MAENNGILKPPYTLRDIWDMPISGVQIAVFYKSLIDSLGEGCRDENSIASLLESFQVPKVPDQYADCGRYCPAVINAIYTHSMIRSLVEHIFSGREELRFDEIISLAENLKFTDEESEIISAAIILPRNKSWDEKHPNQQAFHMIIFVAMRVFATSLATQHERINSYLTEEMIKSFNAFYVAGCDMHLDHNASVEMGGKSIKIKYIGETDHDRPSPQAEEAQRYLKRLSEYNANRELESLYRAELYRLEALYIIASLNGEQRKFLAAYNEIFASSRFASFSFAELGEKIERGEEIEFMFSPTLFVDSVEARFLNAVESKGDIVAQIKSAFKQSAKISGLPIPDKYQGNFLD